VGVSHAGLAICRVVCQVVLDGLEDVAFFDLLVFGQVEGFKVDKLDQCATHVDAEPGEVLNKDLKQLASDKYSHEHVPGVVWLVEPSSPIAELKLVDLKKRKLFLSAR
jgi:hypothetical protein